MSEQWFEAMLQDFLAHPEGPGLCPSDDEVLAYIQARLDDAELDEVLQRVEQHVKRCPACKSECDDLIELLSVEELEPLPRPIRPLNLDFLSQARPYQELPDQSDHPWVGKVLSQLETLIERWHDDRESTGRLLHEALDRMSLIVSPLPPGPAAAGVRAGALENPYRYHIPELDLEVTFTVEETAQGWVIDGVLQPELADRSMLEDITFILRSREGSGRRVYQTAQTDDLGTFVFEDLASGEYVLEIPLSTNRMLTLTDISLENSA